MSEQRGSREGGNGFEREFGKFFKSLCYILIVGFLCFMIFVVLALFRISSYSFYTYNSINNIPHREVGLLLGTSSHTVDGNENAFFVNRIRAAALLYKKGKIDYILVSGDNRHRSYNEPRQMTNALIKAGVPRSRIVADYAGFSTIDSVARASKVFLLKDVTIISQEFHNERALFIANDIGLDAIGFNAADPQSKLALSKVYVREFFARLKCILDIYFLNTQPTFLGDPVQIGSSPMPKQISNKPKHITSKPKQITNASHGPHSLLDLSDVPPKEPSDSARFLRQQEAARAHLQEVVKRDNDSYTPPNDEATETNATAQ